MAAGLDSKEKLGFSMQEVRADCRDNIQDTFDNGHGRGVMIQSW